MSQLFYLPDDTQNYYFREDKAYTEDHVLVYNLFFHKVLWKVTAEDLFRYFSAYGEVLKIHIIPDKKRSKRYAPKVGFVNFVDATAAAKVLLNTNHEILFKRFYLKACDSWNQPNALRYDTICLEKTDNKEVIGPPLSSSESTSIMVLNDDCLEHVCRQLDLRNQVRFARVCKRFREVFRMSSKVEYKTLKVESMDSMTLWEIRDFFEICGESIDTITGILPFKDRERIFEFMTNFCTKLASVLFAASKLRNTSLRRMLRKMSTITELQLNDCSLNDASILAIKQLPSLTSLSLSENYELTGKNLEKLTQLKKLNLYCCGNIQTSYFAEMCRCLIEVSWLDIRRCDRLTVAAFTEMVKHMHNLETLKIPTPYVHYECVAELPKLKNLEILTGLPSMPVRNELFKALVHRKSNMLELLKIVATDAITYDRAVAISRLTQLKHLNVSNNEELNDDCLRRFSALKNLEDIVLRQCPQITNSGLLELVRKCTKLKRVDVQHCFKIDDSFVTDVIEILKKRGSQNHEPITFYIFQTSINYYIVNSPPYETAQSLIKLVFNCHLLTLEDQNHYEFDQYLEGGDFGFEEENDDLYDLYDFNEDVDFYDPYDDYDYLDNFDNIDDEYFYDIYYL